MSYPTGRSDTMTEDWEIRIDETDLNRILDKIDGTEGRNDALRDYIYALRDLQWAHNWSATTAADRADAEIYGAQRAVNDAFDRLIRAQRALSAEIELPGRARKGD
jgi:hypothetical protein